MKFNLRKKALILIGIIAIVSSVIFIFTSQYIILNGFESLEEKDANKNLKRATLAIDADLEHLKSITWDYAQWEDTYIFAKDLNQEYIDGNIIDETFNSLNINLIVITDLDGKPVYSTGFDTKQQKFIPVPEDLIAHIANNEFFLASKNLGDLKSEIAPLKSGPIFLGSRGITKTDGTGKIDHILFFGYFFDKDKVASLSKQTELKLSIKYPDSDEVTAFDKKAAKELGSNTSYVIPLNKDEVEGFTYYKNSNGVPIFLIEAVMDRATYKHGITILNYSLGALISLAVLFGLTTFLIMDRFVIRRIVRVGAKVSELGNKIESGSLSVDSSLVDEFKGDDEISDLALEFDKAYEKLIATHSDLIESEDIFRNISTNLNEALMMTDQNGLIIFWNDAAEKMFSLEKIEVINKLNFDKVISDRAASVHIKSFANHESADVEVKGRTIETFATRPDGNEFPIQISISAAKIKGDWHTISLIRDMSDIKAFEMINQLAKHDNLTGLPNRLCLSDNLRRAIGHAERTDEKIAIHHIDIDNFKDINDTLGHDLGDMLVLAITERLRTEIRKEDCLARIGGDEFVVIQEEAGKLDSIAHFSSKLLEILSKKFDIDGNIINVTSSIGISVLPAAKNGSTVDPLDMLKESDLALTKAKTSGRNTYKFYSQEISDVVAKRLKIISELREAIEKQQFILHYQPIYDTKTEKIIGAEALVRWVHPTRGIVSPLEFIGLSETSGLIIPIGKWVLKEACREAATWQQKYNKKLEISVNLSIAQFERENMPVLITEALVESGLQSSQLCIEITESFFIKNPQATIKILHEMHALGIKISIDDFGTGYSSLSYLKDFPADTLKIDKTFIDDITSYGGGKIAEATIMLGHNLDLTVLAEGVETVDQVKFLREKGCDQIQGFHYSKPLPASEIAKLLDS